MLVKAYSQSYGFSSSHVQKWESDHKEGQVPKNWCFQIVLLEKTIESPLDCKEIKPVNPKGNKVWILIGRTDAETTWCEELTHWMSSISWCWERLGEEGDRGWDGWMASLTQWTGVWVDSGSWWWTGMPGMLRFSGSQRVGHDWATELNWTLNRYLFSMYQKEVGFK